MIKGYRNIINVDPALQGTIRNVYKDALGVLDEVAISEPTRDTLPHGYVQFANINSARKLYINIDNVIHEIGNITPNNLSITSQAQGSLLYYHATTSWTALGSGASTQFLKGGVTPAWGTVSSTNLDDVSPAVATNGGVLYYGTNSITATASGASTQYLKGGPTLTWDTPETTSDIEWISTTSVSATQNTGDITIEQGVSYLVKFYIEHSSGNATTYTMRFNSDSSDNYANSGTSFSNTPDSSITMCSADNSNDAVVLGHLVMSSVNTDQMMVQGSITYVDTGGNLAKADICGYWDASTTVTDFEFLANQNFDAKVILYKFNES